MGHVLDTPELNIRCCRKVCRTARCVLVDKHFSRLSSNRHLLILRRFFLSQLHLHFIVQDLLFFSCLFLVNFFC